MKKISFISVFILSMFSYQAFAQLEVLDNNTLKLGGENANIYLGTKGKYGDVAGKIFDPGLVSGEGTGLVIENGTGESSGIYFDSDFIVLWSPGDGGTNTKGTAGYLVKVYDEDGWQMRWFLDGAGTAFTNSDSSRKDDVEQLNNSLAKIKKMRSVKYYYKKTNKVQGEKKQALAATNQKTEDKCPGFIAQEVESIMPEVVKTDETGTKFVNYAGIIPYTVQAIQEQQTIIDEQAALLKKQSEEIDAIKAELAELKKLLKKKN